MEQHPTVLNLWTCCSLTLSWGKLRLRKQLSFISSWLSYFLYFLLPSLSWWTRSKKRLIYITRLSINLNAILARIAHLMSQFLPTWQRLFILCTKWGISIRTIEGIFNPKVTFNSQAIWLQNILSPKYAIPISPINKWELTIAGEELHWMRVLWLVLAGLSVKIS